MPQKGEHVPQKAEHRVPKTFMHSTVTVPRGSCAVMARRAEPPDSLDWFPTPPWATRALLERVLFERLEGDDWPMVVRRPWLGRWSDDDGWPGLPVKLSVLEPAAGEGHMAEVLREYFDRVHATCHGLMRKNASNKIGY
jgi:hypothetical protein